MKRKSKEKSKEQMKNTSETQRPEDELVEMDIPVTGSGSEPVTDHDTSPAMQYAELNDKYLRLYSDFDNFRKRTLKEKVEISKYASAEIIKNLLPVLDDFERAIKAFDVTTDAGKAMKDGVLLIFSKFLSVMQQQGLSQMRTIGESFDTDFHEAITNIPAPQPEQKGRIVDEIEKGYLLNGKVIRYAKVVVGS